MNIELVIFITVLLAIFVGYFSGSLIWSSIIGKFFYNINPVNLGSGSAGSTNTGRFLPKKVKYLVFILDALKGVIPVLIIYGIQSTLFKDYLIKTVYFDSFLLSYIAGLFGIIGHCFPIFFKFKGGKGIASFFGLICMLSILITIGGCIVWYIVFKIKKTVSLASIMASLSTMLFIFIPGFNFFYLLDDNINNVFTYLSSDIYITTYIFLLLLLVNIIVIYSHRDNIHKLRDKKEYYYNKSI